MSIHYFRFTHRSAGSPQRAPLLERLLARAPTPTVVADWRADAFRLIAPQSASMPGVGAAALCAEQGWVDAASVFIATPVHYVAEMSNVRLAADGILSLSRPEADALAADFNRVWHDAGMRLLCGRSQTPQAPIEGGTMTGPPSRGGRMPEQTPLFCVTDRALDAVTRDPGDVLDRHIEDYLPTGADAPRLRRLMSEIEMWLFEHAVNRTRSTTGMPAMNGLWLWGGGPALASLPPVQGWTAGQDPFFKAFATPPERGGRMPEQTPQAPAGGGPTMGTPQRGGRMPEQTPQAPAITGAHAASSAAAAPGADETSRGVYASGVVVIDAEPGTDAWRDVGSGWLERSVDDLNSGRISRLDLSAGARCFSVKGRWNWRPWRRRRAWWESFE